MAHPSGHEHATADDQAVDLLDSAVAIAWDEKKQLRRDWRENLSAKSADELFMLTVGLGAWGVLSGYAVFVLLWEHLAHHELMVFAGALMVAAVVGWMTEYLRERIDHGASPGGMFSRLPVTILMLGLFELFISAWHTASEMGRERVVEAGLLLLGDKLAEKLNAEWALMAVAVLWVVEGAVLAGVLTMTLLKQTNVIADLRHTGGWKRLLRPAGKSALIGGLAGIIAGAAGLLLTIVVMRVIGAIHLIITEPEQWLALVRSMTAATPTDHPHWITQVLFRPVEWLTMLWQWGAYGPLLTIAAIVALVYFCRENKNYMPLLVILLGLSIIILSPVVNNLGAILWMMLMAALVWVVPGFCLGFLVPMLRGPASVPRVWGMAAFGAAACLAMITLLTRHAEFFPLQIGMMVVVGLGGVIFWRGGALARYWPLAALTMATYVGLVTAAQQATFEGVLHGLIALSEKELPADAPPKPTFLRELDNFKNFRYQPASPLLRDTLGAGNPFSLENIGKKPATTRSLLNLLTTAPTTRPSLFDQYKLNPPSRFGLGAIPLPPITPISADGPLIHSAALAAAVTEEAEELLKRQRHTAEQSHEAIEHQLHAIHERRASLEDALKMYLKTPPPHTGPPDDWPDRKAQVMLRRLTITEHRLNQQAELLHGLTTQPAPTMSVGQTFELSVTGSLAFWITVGLLVGWSSRTHQPLVVTRKDGKRACFWSEGNLAAYHDHIHGKTPADDRELFERLCLELLGTYETTAREKLRHAFAGFVPETLATMDARKLREAIGKEFGTTVSPQADAVILIAKKFAAELKRRAAASGANAILTDWQARAAINPIKLADDLRKDLGLTPTFPVGTFLMSIGLVHGAHFAACDAQPAFTPAAPPASAPQTPPQSHASE